MAAQYGVATFRTQAGNIPVQVYLDDTAGNAVLWDVGGGDAAKGAEEYRPNVPAVLVDVVIAAATGQTKTTINRANARIATLLNAVHLASVNTRPALAIPCGPNAPLSGNQVA